MLKHPLTAKLRGINQKMQAERLQVNRLAFKAGFKFSLDQGEIK